MGRGDTGQVGRVDQSGGESDHVGGEVISQVGRGSGSVGRGESGQVGRVIRSGGERDQVRWGE